MNIDSILDAGTAFEPRLVTATIDTVSADIAKVSAATPDGSRVVGVMPRTEWFAGASWHAGDTFQALQMSDGPQPLFTVAHPSLVEALLEGLVPEVRSGTVRVMNVARVPGVRAKVAVASTDQFTNPVVACVGRAANRVRKLAELCGGERVDIVEWSSDPSKFLASALAPADPSNVKIDGDRATVVVPAHQMSAAVGAAGLNSQLAGQLVGVSVTIVPDADSSSSPAGWPAA